MSLICILVSTEHTTVKITVNNVWIGVQYRVVFATEGRRRIYRPFISYVLYDFMAFCIMGGPSVNRQYFLIESKLYLFTFLSDKKALIIRRSCNNFFSLDDLKLGR